MKKILKAIIQSLGPLVWFLRYQNQTGFIFKIRKILTLSMFKYKLKFMGNQVSIHPSVYMRNPENISVGNKTSINHGSEIYGAGSVTIGEGTMIAYRTIIMSDTRTFMGEQPLKLRTDRIAKAVEIGNDVWIGAGCTILPGITIADHAVVAAGSVVTKSVKEWEIVGGNPAKPISSRI